MYKRILALLLSLSMALCLLTGCSTSSADSSADASVQAGDPADGDNQAVMEAINAAIPDEAKKDVISYLTDGALNKDSTILTVNGDNVKASYYLFWLARELNNLNLFYTQYGMPLDLSSEFREGKTIAQYLQESAENGVKTYYSIEQKAEEEGLELTDEEKAAVESYVAGLDDASVIYYGTTLEDQRTTYSQNQLNSELNAHLTETGELSATEETIQDYIKDNGYYNCRYILFQVAEDASEEDDAAQKEKCQQAYDELSKLEGDALLAKFQEYQKDNPDGNTDEFTFDSTTSLTEGFREKLAELKEGELGMTDKTSYGYFTLLRLPVDTESVKSDYLQSAYHDMVSGWADGAEVKNTAEFDKLDVTAVCTKLLELQNLMNDAAQNATAAAEGSASAAS